MNVHELKSVNSITLSQSSENTSMITNKILLKLNNETIINEDMNSQEFRTPTFRPPLAQSTFKVYNTLI